MTDFIQASFTTDDRDQADLIARRMVERRLAACAQLVGPIHSTYWWKGRVESSEEWLCLLKTRRTLFDRLREAIAEAHPYEVPEIIATPIVAGHGAYMDWMARELASG